MLTLVTVSSTMQSAIVSASTVEARSSMATIEYGDAEVLINGVRYTPEDIDELLQNTYEIEGEPQPQTRSAIALAAGTYFIPGIGQVVITAAGVILIGGAVVKAGSWLYNKVKAWASTKKEIDNAKNKIPSRLKNASGNVVLSKFNRNKNGNKYEPKGWYISRDRSGHKGGVWKLFNKSGSRIATLDGSGKVVGK